MLDKGEFSIANKFKSGLLSKLYCIDNPTMLKLGKDGSYQNKAIYIKGNWCDYEDECTKRD